MALYFVPPISNGEPPDSRGRGGPPHPGLVVSQARAAGAAARLFPDMVADGKDCRAEFGREGQPCRICAERNKAWAAKVTEVRRAMLAAFA